MSGEELVSGRALVGRSLECRDVTIVVSSGKITAIEDESRAPPRWICPAFFDAHTHLGDTVAMDLPVSGDLAGLVAPPDGLKHRILRETPGNRLVAAMRSSIRSMVRTGTAGFADFREGGVDGVRALAKASAGLSCRPLVFGRSGGELAGDGLGVSSTRDVTDLDRLVRAAKDAGKMIAFHAGERDSRDIDEALSFDPDFLVHCTYATTRHLKQCADGDVPIVVCPRSNWELGLTAGRARPPVRQMLELGCTVLLGTDNAMFVQPDMPAEISFLRTVCGAGPREALDAAVRGSLLGGTPHYIETGNRACFFIIDTARWNLRFSRDQVSTITKRLNGAMIVKKVFTTEHQLIKETIL